MHSSAGRLRLCMGPAYRVCVFVCTVAAFRGVGESKDWVPVPCSPAPHTPAPTGALKFWFVCFSSFIFVCLRCLPVSCASHRHPVCGLGIWPRVRVTAPRCPVFASHLSALLVGAPARWAWPVPTLVCIHPCLPVYFSCQGHGVCVCAVQCLESTLCTLMRVPACRGWPLSLHVSGCAFGEYGSACSCAAGGSGLRFSV